MTRVLIVENYYGGSHKALVDVLVAHYPESTVVTMPAKKWGWRMRCSSVYLSRTIPRLPL